MSRPKKVVLLVDANAEFLSCWTVVLETRGYRVLPASSATEALELLAMCPRLYRRGRSVDVLVSEMRLQGGALDGNALARRARMVESELPVLLFSRSVLTDAAGLKDARVDAAGTVFLPKSHATAAVLLDRVRMLAVRKRGPKKRPAPEVGAAMESAA